MHFLGAASLASELKGASPDGQLMFECAREKKPDAESRLYLWEKSKPENRKLVFSVAHPVTAVKISPDGAWIAVLVDLPKPGQDIALLRRNGALEYENWGYTGEGSFVRQVWEAAYRGKYQDDPNPYAVSLRQANIVTVLWSSDSKKLSIFFVARFVSVMVGARPNEESSIVWEGELAVKTMQITPATPKSQEKP
jgi:hypothetical protein